MNNSRSLLQEIYVRADCLFLHSSIGYTYLFLMVSKIPFTKYRITLIYIFDVVAWNSTIYYDVKPIIYST